MTNEEFGNWVDTAKEERTDGIGKRKPSLKLKADFLLLVGRED